MKEKKLISVIIPVYNVETYLRECVNSVLCQTYQNFEIILADDGSTDSSGEICDEYAAQDHRIIVVHQKNGGLSAARNRGLSEAKGEYVYFLDSDDWIIPETLSELIDRAQIENADLVFFDAVSFIDGSREQRIEQRYVRKWDYQADRGYRILERLQNNKEYHSAVPLLFIRRSFLQEANILFEDGIIYEDMLFTYQVFCKAERTAYWRNAAYQRRYRSDSIMTSKKSTKNYISARIVYEKVRDFSIDIEKINDNASQTYIIRCAFNALNLFHKLNSNQRKECRKDYQLLKSDIIQYNAYGNRALYMRCYGRFLWFCYKLYEKLFVR